MIIDKTKKILIDADVIIHFIKGGQISIINKIFPNDLILFDIVFNEVFIGASKPIVENMIKMKLVKEIKFDNSSQKVKNEYSKLRKEFGKGESAIMAWCSFNEDIIASSNLKDITNYCKEKNILYLSTMDFIAEAFRKSILSEAECNEFITIVKSNRSKLIKEINTIKDFLDSSYNRF